ncbi:hypothetical protein CPT_Solomon_066 [Klebsiella phage Solomon]|uniref:Uncharacterized protein n=1 Tax=Klebsiella phage Solomon TaxID=2767583 RepID=A0A873WVF8_9CAUD|nr:hypothetical protein CPT_Solomon_066 [Klebsiella phage Solomon]
MKDPKLNTVTYRDHDGDELIVSPFSGGAAGVELMATHDSGCCVFDDPAVIRNLANQLLAVADAVDRVQEHNQEFDQ